MLIVCVANQKGGVGKTATADALAGWLRSRGRRTLAIDLDAQRNLTAAHGVPSGAPTVADAIEGRTSPAEAVFSSGRGDIIPGDAFLDVPHVGAVAAMLRPLAARYDYAVIDTPPAMGKATAAAMRAADALVVPTTADAFGIAALEAILINYRTAKKRGWRVLWAGAVLTRHTGRTSLAKAASARISSWAEEAGVYLAPTPVRDCVAVREAQLLGQGLFDRSPRCAAAKDYAAAFGEIFNHIGWEA